MAILTFLLDAALIVSAQAAPGQGANDLVSSAIRRRVVATFDFDERKRGNYETMPMNWQQIAGPGFPRFLEPRMDEEVGHPAPPSFHLSLAGGSVGCYYLSQEISVHPESDYRISAWILPDRLRNARAVLSAYFLDYGMNKLAGSERRAPAVRGDGGGSAWRKVSLTLPGGFEKARWIGLACYVEQAPPAESATPLRPIERHDVRAGAWFDDMTVTRLPRATLSLDERTGVYLADRPAVCDVIVADVDASDLAAELTVATEEGSVVRAETIALVRAGTTRQRFTLADLPAGRYTVTLVLRSGELPLSRRVSRFVRLAAPPDWNRPPEAGGQARGLGGRPTEWTPSSPRVDGGHGNAVRFGAGQLGVWVDRASLREPALLFDLIDRGGFTAVKLPLWHSGLSDEGIVSGDSRLETLIRTLSARGIQVVGSLEGVPASLLRKFGHPGHTVLDVLAAAPDLWRPYLGFLFARYGQRVGAWQIGTDGSPFSDSQRLAASIIRLRGEFRQLVGDARFVIPHDVRESATPDELPADVLSMTAPPSVSSDRLVDQLAPFAEAGFTHRWVSLVPLPKQTYERRARLIEFARRLVAVRLSGAESIFIPAPWQIEEKRGAASVIPQEELIIARSLSRALAGRTPVGELRLGEDVVGVLFTEPEGDSAVLAAWTGGDSLGPHEIAVDAGSGARRYDVWGVATSPKMRGDEARFEIEAMPTVIAPVSAWRMRTAASFALDDPHVPVSLRAQRRRVSLTNYSTGSLTGDLTFEPSPGWRVSPRKVALNVAPNATAEIPIELALPTNHPSGPTRLSARFSGGGGDSDRIELHLRAPLQVGVAGIDMNVLARRDGESLRVVQRVTNHTGRTLDLRSYILFPPDGRQSRLIRQLGKGETAVREFVIERPAALARRPLRVSVEEVNGPLRHHEVVRLD